METQHGIRVAIFHLDNDTALINKDTRGQLARSGTVFEPSTPYPAHQNAIAESSNRMTETRSCNMLIAAPHLPKALWPYAARYVVELLNHHPTTAVPCGKTPRQMFLEHMKVVNPMPSLHSVRTFGEPVYVHTPVQKRIQSAKFQPRATKMYFVGSESSCIYHMWDSATGKVHRSSSVTWAKHELVKLPQALGNELPQALRNELPQTSRNELSQAMRNAISCQPGTSVHRVHVNCISHVTLRHLLTHLGCVYNRSM
jgi:predicted SnoaL-like aldol condensation-catalyzing enzyme